jgi:putative ABC transport system permease protein
VDWPATREVAIVSSPQPVDARIMRSGAFRTAWRTLYSRPALALTRVLTIAVIIAAVSSVLAVANATIFNRLPYPSPGRLVRVALVAPGGDRATDTMTLYPIAFARLRDTGKGLASLEGSWLEDHAVTGAGEPETLSGVRVTPGYLPLLGASMVHGRTFSVEEALRQEPVVVLAHSTWMRLFGGDASVLGRTLTIDREAHTVIGVLSRHFESPSGTPDFYLPLDHRRNDALRATVIQTVGRLPAGGTIEQAESALATALAEAEREVPDLLRGHTVTVRDLGEALYGSRRPALVMLMIAVVALTFVAIANLTNLTIADQLGRQADFAIRLALGGSRFAIAKPEVAQCALIAALGLAAGLAAAASVLPGMLALDPSGAFVTERVAIDWRVVLASTVAAAVVMVTTVLIPFVRLSRAEPGMVLAASGRRLAGSRQSRRLRTVLVGMQAAITLVLLSSAALIVAALLRTAAVAPGFDATNVVTAQLRLSGEAFPDPEARARFVSQLLDRLRDVPGIIAAGTTLNRFRGGSYTTNVSIEGQPTPDGTPYSLQFRRVSPGYFDAMRIKVISGRAFTLNDDATALPVAIVSRSFAERFWPAEDPIGRRVRRGAATSPPITIVGVVDDVRDAGLGVPPAPTLYTPFYQGSSAAAPVALVVRTAGNPAATIAAIKNAVWSVDPHQPLSHIVTLEDVLAASLGPQRFRAILVALCGAFGLLLATIGTYAVTARSVSERTREVGIRIAVGGDPRDVWWTLASQGARAVATGAVFGLGVSAIVDRSMVSLLPEIGDPTWRFRLSAAVALALVGTLSSVLAARRTVTIDPLRALQAE